LLSTMSEHHARRARPSNASRARRWRLLLAFIAIPAVAIAPEVYRVLVPPSTEDGVEIVVKQAGFDPLLPPSRLRGPGAIYEVEGGFYRKVCDAAPDVLQGKTRKSPIQNQTRERLEQTGFSVGAKLVETVNAKLGASRVTSIEYRLTDAAITEIAESELADIQDQLLSQKSCDKTVQRLLKAHRKVCAGYAALSATTFYKVQFDSMVASGDDTRAPIINAVQQAMAVHTQGEIKTTGTDELIGQDLFYGIQLSSLCITLDTATEPSVLGESPAAQPATPLEVRELPRGS